MKFNTIYNMDCVEGLRQLDDDSIDLIVTSPPYNLGIDYDEWDDSMPVKDYLQWCFEWLQQCFRVLKDDGRICINHYLCCSPQDSFGNHFTWFPLTDIRLIMEDIGYGIHSLALWDDGTVNTKTAWGSYLSASAPNIQSPYEGILIGYKHQWKKLQKGQSTIDKETFIEGCYGVWHIGTTTGLTKACFPEELPRMCIELFSYSGDVVLDPFSGSGTTGVVANKNGRKYIGIELNREYADMSIERLNDTNAKKVLW